MKPAKTWNGRSFERQGLNTRLLILILLGKVLGPLFKLKDFCFNGQLNNFVPLHFTCEKVSETPSSDGIPKSCKRILAMEFQIQFKNKKLLYKVSKTAKTVESSDWTFWSAT